jgi:predicted ATP-dependent endonuclease of OLD family
MRLARLRLRNFRCYRDETAIDFDNITALVGRNDSGKSTIMEALDLFLNDGDPDKDDASKDGDAKDLHRRGLIVPAMAVCFVNQAFY